MQQIDNIVNYFISLDTKQIIDEIATEVLGNDVIKSSFPKCIGIIVLATEDAKTSKEPASTNELYLEVYNEVKRLLLVSNNKGIWTRELNNNFA